MPTRYIYRMDDITPDMNWKQFWKYIELFGRYGVKPLLGIVPDNQDPLLSIHDKNKNFWNILRELKSDDKVEFAQHGYKHILHTSNKGIIGKAYGVQQKSEFAGLTYEEQFSKIKAGQDILKRESIFTDVWMAPCHSFDKITLKALVDLGFKAITDGISLYPYYKYNLIFIPQQVGKPKKFLFGIITICLHVNSENNNYYERVEKHLKENTNFISFSDARKYKLCKFDIIVNTSFRTVFIFTRFIQSILRKGSYLLFQNKKM